MAETFKITVYLKEGGVSFTGEYECTLDGSEVAFESGKIDEPDFYFNWNTVIYWKRESA